MKKITVTTLLWYWFPPLIIMGIIFFLSSRPRIHVSDDVTVQFVFFKTLHMIEYGILFLTLVRALYRTNPEPFHLNNCNAVVLSFMFAVSDEIHQTFVPTRQGAFRDVVIDMIGILIAYFIVWKLLPLLPKRLKKLVTNLGYIA